MQSQIESQQISYKFVGDCVRIFNKPLKKYVIDFGEYAEVLEATNMVVREYGVEFESVIIRNSAGDRIGVGRTFIAHGQYVGITLIEEEYGSMCITDDTKLSLFGVG